MAPPYFCRRATRDSFPPPDCMEAGAGICVIQGGLRGRMPPPSLRELLQHVFPLVAPFVVALDVLAVDFIYPLASLVEQRADMLVVSPHDRPAEKEEQHQNRRQNRQPDESAAGAFAIRAAPAIHDAGNPAGGLPGHLQAFLRTALVAVTLDQAILAYRTAAYATMRDCQRVRVVDAN